jgi:hypothetical protein
MVKYCAPRPNSEERCRGAANGQNGIAALLVSLILAPRVGRSRRDNRMIVHFVIAFVITLLAAFGIMMIHYNGLMHPDSLGIGMGAFA